MLIYGCGPHKGILDGCQFFWVPLRVGIVGNDADRQAEEGRCMDVCTTATYTKRYQAGNRAAQWGMVWGLIWGLPCCPCSSLCRGWLPCRPLTEGGVPGLREGGGGEGLANQLPGGVLRTVLVF